VGRDDHRRETAFFAATIGLVQNDIKRVIAYSTCSQLGYMFAAAGVGAYEAAMFHLFTHAFFKALLFLGAGSVIHAMHHEQDMRKMGGLKAKIPLTFWMMMIGTLAITGVGVPFLYILDTPIGFAGFVSKDVIIESSFAAPSAASGYAFTLLLIAAAFTSFYSWRLMFMTFYGETRADHHTYDHAHESPRVMTWPLMALAIGAALAGMEFYPDFVGHHEGAFWAASIFNGAENHVLHDSHDVPGWVKLSPFIAMLGGLAVAFWFYRSRRTCRRRWRRGIRRSTSSCSTSGGSTSSMTGCWCARSWRWGGSSGRRATARPSTGRSTGWRWGRCPGSRGSRGARSRAISITTPSSC
jgi:NADH-quinone oxidoreductase subunit L